MSSKLLLCRLVANLSITFASILSKSFEDVHTEIWYGFEGDAANHQPVNTSTRVSMFLLTGNLQDLQPNEQIRWKLDLLS
ncbi:MAG: hypothetical protein JXJ17_01735 [Anaerolineae bacterium]|nr:hypothetical protein [Anaerolineae bacterium]